MDTDLPSYVPTLLNRQDRPVLLPVDLAFEIEFSGYPWRLAPQVEFRMLDTIQTFPTEELHS